MGRIKKIIGSVMLVASLLTIMTTDVIAETSSSLTVSPPNQEIILMPGEVYEGSIVVANPNGSENDLEYSVSIGSFSQKQSDGGVDDYGTVDTDTVLPYNQMMEWIKLGKENGVISPNQSDKIPFTITVPEDAAAGGQYATILVQDDTKMGDNSNGNIAIESKVRIASIIYAEVAGETREEGTIISNNIPTFSLSNKLEASSIVKNNGNVHTNAEYILQVWPLFSDEEICTNEESVGKSLIMPETEKYHIESCNLPVVGIFKAKQTVKIFGETSITERTVIVCPAWLLFLILFGLTAIIIYFIARAKARRAERRSAE